MKRKVFYISIAAVVLILALLAIGGVNILKSARSGEAVLEKVAKTFEVTPSLGDLVNLELSCAIPWGQNINGVYFTPGEGILLQESIKTSIARRSLHNRIMKITVPVKSYRSGKLDLGKVELTVERPLHKSTIKKQSLSCALDSMEFAPLKIKDPDQLPLADSAVKSVAITQQYRWFWLSAAAVILIIAVIIFIWLRAKNQRLQQDILPPWVIAQRNLEELRKTANAGKQPLSWCVAKLSDVVRDYLSIRFSWKIKQQTTEEFFASLKRKNSPLNAAQTFYLEEFMKQSDLVKFANIKPDRDTFAQAVDRAEELINQTGKIVESAGSDTGSEVKK